MFRFVASVLFAVAFFGVSSGLLSKNAHAAVTLSFVESGSNVVATHSGSINTTGLVFAGNEILNGAALFGTAFWSGLQINSYNLGTPQAYLKELSGFETDVIISGGSYYPASSASGDNFGMTVVPTINGDDKISLANGYVSGDPLSGTATWNSKTLASLGLRVGTYVVTLPSDTITIYVGSAPADTTNPTLSSSSPADNATGVSVAAPTLSLVFDEPVFPQSGVLRMYKTSDDTQVNNRSVTGSTGSGTPNISISFENALEADTEYYVLIPATAFQDAAGNSYAGISSTTELSFTTAGAPPANQPPVPSYTYNCTDLDCSFDGSGSSDPDGNIVTWEWTFDDGSLVYGEMVDHSFFAAGTYNVVLAVIDDDDAKAWSEGQDVTVTVRQQTYTVGGAVSGLTGAGLELQNNGGDTLAIAADGGFVFATALADTSAYAVTVSTQPTGQTCNVSGGSGSIAAANVTDVDVACVDDVVPPVVPPRPMIPVPTLSEWALILLTMFIGLMVFANRRRLF